MNQSLKSRFEVELRQLSGEGIAGEALEKELLDRKNKKIKIPNALYCALIMLGDEYKNPDVLFTEYCGRCFKSDCVACPCIKPDNSLQWCFWYTRLEYALNVTATTDCNLLDDKTCANIAETDRGENDIRLKMYAKLACQCMAIYDTSMAGCYLPIEFFRMVKYFLFLCSYKAFFMALKSAVKYCDAETNYAIRETLGTVLGLKDVRREKIYSKISKMQGNEKAAVARMIAVWGVGGDLQKNLFDMIHKFERNICLPEIRGWIKEHEEELERVLGSDLLYHLQKHCWKNAVI